jgi:hypothetical protein
MLLYAVYKALDNFVYLVICVLFVRRDGIQFATDLFILILCYQCQCDFS